MNYKTLLFAWILSMFIFSAQPGGASELYFIDAHSQVDHEVRDLDLIIKRMDSSGVYKTILSPRGSLRDEEFLAFAASHPHRILTAMRTKGGKYRDNSLKYFKLLKRRILSGKYRAIAEVLIYHDEKRKAPRVLVYPSDQRVRAALEISISKGWPFFAHIEFASVPGEIRERLDRDFEEMLTSSPEHPFVLTSIGQLEAADARELIEKHGNLYFHTATTNPVLTRRSVEPWVDVFRGGNFKPEWKELFIEHPDRFLFALDNVWASHWKKHYSKQVTLWRKALAGLPEEAAHAIAHGNAERLWGITPKGQ